MNDSEARAAAMVAKRPRCGECGQLLPSPPDEREARMAAYRAEREGRRERIRARDRDDPGWRDRLRDPA